MGRRPAVVPWAKQCPRHCLSFRGRNNVLTGPLDGWQSCDGGQDGPSSSRNSGGFIRILKTLRIFKVPRSNAMHLPSCSESAQQVSYDVHDCAVSGLCRALHRGYMLITEGHPQNFRYEYPFNNRDPGKAGKHVLAR